MEEQKNNEIKLERPVPGKKLPYNKLNEVCMQLHQQNQYYENQIKGLQRELNGVANMFTRLDYLFRVVEFADKFRDPDFINSCLDEIKELMTLKQKQEPQKEEEK